MKPSIKQLLPLCKNIEQQLVKDHITNLNSHYFSCFTTEEIAEHLISLNKLSEENPVETTVNVQGENIEIILYSFDCPFAFAAITGIMASVGLNICMGEVFTYTKNTIYNKRLIIDRFICTYNSHQSFSVWHSAFIQRLKSIFALLNQPYKLLEARQKTNEWVACYLSLSPLPEAFKLPTKIYIDNKRKHATRFKIIGKDTPFFLYTLSNALSLYGIAIENVKIQTNKDNVVDIIETVDQNRQKITDSHELNHIKSLVLLVKQFTYFLSYTPDPYVSLTRFEYLVEDILHLPDKRKWLKKLSTPKWMSALARISGASDFLWNKFMLGQYKTLFSLLETHFCEKQKYTNKSAKQRLLDSLRTCKNLEAKKISLNEFKDKEIFAIELNQILNPRGNIRNFSQQLTQLAETTIEMAVKAIYRDLVQRFGEPISDITGQKSNYVVMGLGKLGGCSLGYASDLELLFVYEHEGMTNSKSPMDNLEFFQCLVRKIIKFIHASPQGIFEIDLRLRPYGVDGPLTCSLESFKEYYGQGEAHSLEKLALITMRTICGSHALGKKVENLRNQYVYQLQDISPSEIYKMRQQQLEVKNIHNKLNAKYSIGALVDIEYSVQMLQMLHGKKYKSLQTTNIYKALEALAQTEIISQQQSNELKKAYVFFSKLINALRMLRGNASDTFLPTIETPSFLHLAKRMRYNSQRTDKQICKEFAGHTKRMEYLEPLLDPICHLCRDWNKHTTFVKSFVAKYFAKEALFLEKNNCQITCGD